MRLKEERHVDRLYFPEADVRWEPFAPTDHHTVRPFKGEADYRTPTAAEPPMDNVVWAYRTPFPQVGVIEGHVCFYESRVRVELLDHWPGSPEGRSVSTQFPEWGTAADLSAHMIFSKAASFDEPLDVVAEVLRGGRTFSTVQVRTEQGGGLRSAGLVLLDASPPDTIRHAAPCRTCPVPRRPYHATCG